MSKYHNSEELSSLSLGKTTEYSGKYTPDLLQAVPRKLNRDDLSLNSNDLPFVGEDVWYGYELSWLNSKGKPVVAVAEFRFACTSPNLVESKSFKLYLNSFNQTKFSQTDDVKQLLINDLSKVSGSIAQVKLFSVTNCTELEIMPIENSTCIDDIDISIKHYQYQNDLLSNIQGLNIKQDIQVEQKLVSHLLKSNCLITNQPDWASVFIHYKGKLLNHAVLLEYLISFRQHNEFHEQCVERIFCDLQKHCDLEQLTVFARYTRRGGLDINPFRSTHLYQAPLGRTLRQ